jgi:hypothetical protein
MQTVFPHKQDTVCFRSSAGCRLAFLTSTLLLLLPVLALFVCHSDFKYGSRNVLADSGIREGIKEFTGWPTIPQVSWTRFCCPANVI